MSSGIDGRKPSNHARRHFLGLAGATGAKIAATLAVTTALSSLPAAAMGRRARRDRDPNGGANCFLSGTAIETAAGEVPVEALRIGESVKTVDGRTMAVRWIGRQHYKKTGSSWQEGVMPIRIACNALAEGVPRRDLYLSPNHALYVDGLLIRAKDLVNGITIAPALPAKRTSLDYFNVMLDSHAGILAEGLPVESFRLIAGNHEYFDNFAEVDRLLPASQRLDMAPFAPILGYEGGRAHLAALMLMASPVPSKRRDPIQTIRDKIAERAKTLVC